MNCKKLFAPALIIVACLVAAVASIALAQESRDAQPAAQGEFPLPPGWTEADVQAMMLAGTPGKEHEFLAKGVGEWQGKVTMWMYPDAEAMQSECTYTVEPMMDGRYFKCEITGDMAGMGPYHGFGIYGFDNVSRQFVTTWLDNHSTGIMNGTGKQSDNGKTITWTFSHNCPITKKPVVMREIETITGPDTKTLEMFGPEPKSGKEFQMMRIEFAKK
jgi:hypothetical protein